MWRAVLILINVLMLGGCATSAVSAPSDREPFIVVLGIAQDGGIPQAGAFGEPGWTDPAQRRKVACVGIVEPRTGSRWMIDATPDFRDQLYALNAAAGSRAGPALDGVFLTHAHIGHYTGLMFLGHESMGAREIPVHAMPRMKNFLETSGPWSQLVRLGNVSLKEMRAGEPVALGDGISVTPMFVPHRQEFSEVVGFRIAGPRRAVLYIPDIDAWEQWDAMGVRLEDELAKVDVAYVDGTFWANGEIPGRDMTGFPHPFITKTMDRLAPLPESERKKVRFIHLNHTNPAQRDGAERREIERRGFGVAEEGEHVGL